MELIKNEVAVKNFTISPVCLPALDPGFEPLSPVSACTAEGIFTAKPPGKPPYTSLSLSSKSARKKQVTVILIKYHCCYGD